MPDKQNLDSQLLAELAESVQAVLGLSFPPDRYRELERAVHMQVEKSGQTLEQVVQEITSRSAQYIEDMSRFLTVRETYFFREPSSLLAIRDFVLPSLIEERRAAKRLKIWSAGCCTGEEAYSLAMLLPRLTEDWQVYIYGTDINFESLDTARLGIYSERAVRQSATRFEREGRYLVRSEGGNYQVAEKIKEQVQFFRLNLTDTAYPDFLQNVDLIVCRNVLIYFEEGERRRAIDKFGQCLAPGGWLCLGSAEFAESAGLSVHIIEDPPNIEKTFFLTRPGAGHFDEHHRACRAQFETARRRFQSGDYSGTSRLLKKLEEDLGDSDSQLALQALELETRALTNCGSLEEALERTRRYIVRYPQHAEGYYLQALVLQEKGHGSEAVASLESALAINAHLHLASFMLASYFLSSNQREKASAYLERLSQDLLKLAPETVLSFSDGTTAGELLTIVKDLDRKQ